jgi:putative RNA 2'-phosphotransferase
VSLGQERVSKVVAHALRHEPWLYELELDDDGWVPLSDLLEALRARGGEWASLSTGDLLAMAGASPKRRYDVDPGGGRIRASYGHSVPGRLAKDVAVPPGLLYHGTSPGAWEVIRGEGLRPMRRQCVHLSVAPGMAVQVGRRRAPHPLVLRVRAADAARDGVAFYRGNEHVWLADAVPGAYLALAPPADQEPHP